MPRYGPTWLLLLHCVCPPPPPPQGMLERIDAKTSPDIARRSEMMQGGSSGTGAGATGQLASSSPVSRGQGGAGQGG